MAKGTHQGKDIPGPARSGDPPDADASPVGPGPASTPVAPIDRLVGIMARLRDPDGGCPWDLEQTFATIVPHTIEEAYEVAEIIERGAPDHGLADELKDELGDLLFQVVFYAQMGAERKAFDFNDIAAHVADKMVRRHPHVFGDLSVEGADAMTRHWEAQKADERAEKVQGSGASPGALDGVIATLPGLTHALKLQKRAARVGFDWDAPEPILDKIAEELDEVAAEMAAHAPKLRLQDEVGDLLFAVVNLARHLDVDPDQAIRGTNRKFERRFRAVEARLAAAGLTMEEATLDRMEAEWASIKKSEKQ